MKMLVFGSNGFVGRNVCNELAASHDVVRASRESTEQIPASIRVDLLDQDSIAEALNEVRPEVVINCAGIVGAGMDTEQNVHFTRNILDQVIKVDSVKKVIISGSAGEYGIVSPDHIPVNEAAPLNADTGYGFSKVREEQLALEYQKKYGIGVVVMRIFNPIGKDMADKFLISRLLQQVDECESGERESIDIARLDAKRDYVSVKDVATAFKVVAEGNPRHSVYNVGSGYSTSNGKLLDLILDNSKLEDRPTINETSNQPEPLVAIRADISRLKSEFDWQPTHRIDDVIKEIINDKSRR